MELQGGKDKVNQAEIDAEEAEAKRKADADERRVKEAAIARKKAEAEAAEINKNSQWFRDAEKELSRRAAEEEKQKVARAAEKVQEAVQAKTKVFLADSKQLVQIADSTHDLFKKEFFTAGILLLELKIDVILSSSCRYSECTS